MRGMILALVFGLLAALPATTHAEGEIAPSLKTRSGEDSPPFPMDGGATAAPAEPDGAEVGTSTTDSLSPSLANIEEPANIEDCDPEVGIPCEALQADDGYDLEAYRQFEGTLVPYGEWVDDLNYGKVWRPSEEAVGEDFSPYETAGYFADTDNGWTWVSDFSWGWAPFHYGRWLALPGLGWCWIPGTLWGPAWVSWRFGGGYVGWAPMPPRGVTVGPPTVRRAGWHFTLAGDLGHRSPGSVPFRAFSSMMARTAAVTNRKVVEVGGTRVRVNLGPSRSALEVAIGRLLPASHLDYVSQAMPNPIIVGKKGVPIEKRPWIRTSVSPGSPGLGMVRTVNTGSSPTYMPPPTYSRVPPQSHPAPTPADHLPMPTQHMSLAGSDVREPAPIPVYRSRALLSHSPSVAASTPVYRPSPIAISAPVYHSPPVTVSAPVYRSSPTAASAPVYRSPPVTTSASVYRSPPVAASAPRLAPSSPAIAAHRRR